MGVGVFAGSFFSSLHSFAFARLQGGPQTQRPHEEEPLSGVCHQELQLLQLRPLQQQAQVGSGPPTEGLTFICSPDSDDSKPNVTARLI